MLAVLRTSLIIFTFISLENKIGLISESNLHIKCILKFEIVEIKIKFEIMSVILKNSSQNEKKPKTICKV